MKKENRLKLQFNKQSVTELNADQMKNLYGGDSGIPTSDRTVSSLCSALCGTEDGGLPPTNP
ncbi:class I lanthipeptide [Flavobacterium amniphilum]|uniref:class I lanthipeptide n=1 Tax=Flavobacterium amniphilum TaxID=1834035 RepID=UPI00202A4667|nr:class I lanthipeptide [Flavobacterium amniphilum]MCL9807389.1 class I lanthipeptide [Flavobacterium amniphilum]